MASDDSTSCHLSTSPVISFPPRFSRYGNGNSSLHLSTFHLGYRAHHGTFFALRKSMIDIGFRISIPYSTGRSALQETPVRFEDFQDAALKTSPGARSVYIALSSGFV
ncbi:hypothetical protein QR680_015439 [Steinernema hermaphroditum]|uniref:Uncharacterized protein n=1 Tax=Steinernema hermaphroditum TaxID=289476 RepID=A0AA39H9L9_9BILA|nr:hypothetical protein QR680_015439 [Steinernema hermaphroditum]